MPANLFLNVVQLNSTTVVHILFQSMCDILVLLIRYELIYVIPLKYSISKSHLKLTKVMNSCNANISEKSYTIVNSRIIQTKIFCNKQYVLSIFI